MFEFQHVHDFHLRLSHIYPLTTQHYTRIETTTLAPPESHVLHPAIYHMWFVL